MTIERIPYTSREQWLELRKKDVTASTVAALFGLHPYETPLGLYTEKRGLDLPKGDNKILRRGRLLESAVAEAMREERPDWEITKADDYLRDPSIRLGATPDFYIRDKQGRRGTLQAKTVSPSEFKKSWTEDTPPTWIALQNTTESMLDGADFGAIAALVVDGWNFDLYPYEVPRHPAAEQRIRDAVVKFWDDVDNKREPKIDFQRDARLLPILFPTVTNDKVVDLRKETDLMAKLEKRQIFAESVRELAVEIDEIENELKFKLGDAEAARIDGWFVTYREHARRDKETGKVTRYRKLNIKRDETMP